MEIPTFHLILPPPDPNSSAGVEITSNGAVVIVGANGSGKTRLGTWIELNSSQPCGAVHRISAQKSLEMPLFSTSSSLERARAKLLYGYAEGNVAHRVGHRWQGKPNTALLNDYESLIEYLFTDDYIVARDYKDSVTSASLLENPSESSGKANDSGENALASRNPPESKLDIIKRVWEEIIPHRELLFKNGEITTRVRGSQRSYKAAEMSDGERVIFYLIGQALLAPIDGMIVIDEPELHLHESIQSALWNKIESERPDCLFVYLTHDIDFAASRTTAAKICVRGFDGDLWDWYLVPEDSGIPEDILLEILGSRKPTIFVEGDRGSTDYFVYEKLYPDFTIVPVGGCENVIHSTCSFEALGQLHRLSAHGLVDRDARDDDEIKYLNSRGVHVLDFSEAENLFLTKDVLRIVAEKLHINDFEALFNTIKGEVLDELKNGEEILISSITASKVERSLKNFDAKARGESELQDALSELVGRIDVPALYQSTKTAVGKILAEGDYDGALKIFNNKGLIPRISRVFDYRDLSGFIERLMSDKDGERLLTAMRTKAPQIEA